MRTTLALFTALLCVCVLVPAGTARADHGSTFALFVDAADPNNNPDCGSMANPCETIQAAVNHAEPLKLIFVEAGTYNESVTVNKTLTLLGEQSDVDARTRSGAAESIVTGSGGAFNLSAGGVVIDGFTIDGGDAANGVITAPDASGYVIANNIISDNLNGLDLRTDGTDQTAVRRNAFVDNLAKGVAGTAGASNVLVEENAFSGNPIAAIDLQPPAPIVDVAVSGNTVDDGPGISIAKLGDGAIEDNTFTGWSGAAILLRDATDVVVDGNSMAAPASPTARGVQVSAGSAGTTNLDILGNDISGAAEGVHVEDNSLTDTLDVHHNRIAGNDSGVDNASTGGDQVDATNNWWGCNEGPGQPGCDDVDEVVPGTVEFEPWLVLGLGASPTSIQTDGETSALTADVSRNSDGQTITDNLFPPRPVAFSTSLGNVTSPATTSAGAARSTLTSGSAAGTASVTASLDNEQVTVPVTIRQRPSQQNGEPDDRPPTVSFTGPADGASLRAIATTLTADAADDRGVANVTFRDDGRILCVDDSAPYTCVYQPTGLDVGGNGLTATATDTAGQTAEARRGVQVGKFKARSLSLRATPRSDDDAPYKFTASGRLGLPQGLARAEGCSGRVRVTFKRGRRTAGTKTVRLSRNCSYRGAKAIRGQGRLRVSARFLGNGVMGPRSSAARSVSAG